VPAPTGGVALALDGKEEARVDGACPGGAGATAVMRGDGAVLCVASAGLDTLRAPVTTLYQRRLFPLRLDDVRALDVAAAGKVLSLRRDEGVWRIIAPRSEAAPASDDKVRGVVRALVEAEARGFVSAAPREPLVRVRLASADDEVAVALGTADGMGQARRDGETATLEIDRALVATLAALTPAELRRDGDMR
jgi:hypothetical protein